MTRTFANDLPFALTTRFESTLGHIVSLFDFRFTKFHSIRHFEVVWTEVYFPAVVQSCIIVMCLQPLEQK